MQFVIKRARKSLAVPAHWNMICQSSLRVKKIHNVCIQEVWQRYSPDGMVSGIYRNDYLERAEKGILNRIICDKQYLLTILQKHVKYGIALESLSKKILKHSIDKRSTSFLLKLYSDIKKSWLKFDQYNVLPWFYGADPLQKYIYAKLKNHSNAITSKECNILITAPILSFSSEEELEMCRIINDIKNQKLITKLQNAPLRKARKILPYSITKQIDNLVKRYYWIPFGYDGPMVNTFESYVKTLKSLSLLPFLEIQNKILSLENYSKTIKKNQQKIINRYSISNNIVMLCQRMHLLSKLTDERKIFQYQSHVAFHHVISALAKKLSLPVEVFKYVTLEEIRKNIKQVSSLSDVALSRKKSVVYFHARFGRIRIISNQKKVQLYDKRMFLDYSNQKSVQGNVVSSIEKKIILGRVRVLFSSEEIADFHEGEILVTPMTTPEFVPAMRKAKAIITDEGGVTCHAAIVSRELSKPCIIATKNATRALKTGNKVQVDMESGVVTVL